MRKEAGITGQDGPDVVSLKATKRRGDSLSPREAVFNLLDEAVVIIDRKGGIVDGNDAWHCLHEINSWLGSAEKGEAVFDELELGKNSREADTVILGIQSVIQGVNPEFHGEFSVHHGGKLVWFRLRVKALEDSSGGFAVVSLRDVTSQHKLEHDLRESHLLFQRVIEGTGDGIFIYDMKGRFLMHNSVCLDLFSQTSSQLVGKSIEDVFPEQLARTIRSQNELVIGTERNLEYELVIDTPHGIRTLFVKKGVYRNHRNEAVGIIGISRDVTARKLAEDRLTRSERHFRALIEKSTDCILLLSEKGDILYVSPSSKQFFGYDYNELVGTTVFFWLHPDDLSLAKDRFQELLELPGASMNSEYRALCKDGKWKWIESTGSNLLHDPSVQAIVLNVRDISERKEAEQEARRFTAIVESSIDGIFSVDLEGKIVSWNEAAQRIFGYSEVEMFGKDFRSLIPDDRLGENKEWYDAVFQGKGIRDAETVGLGSGGRRVEVSVTLSPIHGRDRRIDGVAAIVRDISERRRLEKEVLEIADFEKHRIGQDLHDDLCQHLVGISMIGNLLYADLARLGLKQAEEAKEITKMIRNAVDHARILAKGLSPLNIAQGGIMAGLDTLASNTEHLFRIPCRFECATAVHIEDPDIATHLYRIAQEALHNAVKHSKGTMVIIRLKALPDMVEVAVCDDGVGFQDSKKRPKSTGLGMHTMFYRARVIGATLEFLRNPERGVSVVCRLPIPQKNHGNGKSETGE